MTDRRGWLLCALALTLGGARAMEIALIPQPTDEAVATAVRSAAAEVGITVTVLEPAQIIDQARFSPKIYALAVLIGGEKYPDTVIAEGDAAAALQAYVDGGGALLVAATGMVMARPQRWSGSEWQSVPAPLRRLKLITHFGLLDAGQALETAPPAGCEFALAPGTALSDRLPERLPLPEGQDAYRPVPGNQEAGIEFQPVATLVDQQGGTFGAGVAQMRRPAAGGGTVFYVWAPLLKAPYGREILLGLLGSHATRTMPVEEATRRDELQRQLAQLDKARLQAAGVIPAELHTKELDELRASLEQQAGTLHWLGEACRIGNLNFVALRLQKLAGEYNGLPARAGQAVDRAVQQEVANPAVARSVVPLEPPKASTGEPPARTPAGESDDLAPPALAPAGAAPSGLAVPSTQMRDVPVTAPPDPKVTTGGATAEAQPSGETATPAPADGAASEPAEAATPPTTTREEPAQPATTPPQPPVTPVQPTPPELRFATNNPVIELELKNRGKIYLELFPAEAPKTCSAFLYLIRSGFYLETYFHRRVERFVVQGGDPESKTRPPDDEKVGTGGPDFHVPGEFGTRLKHERGTVGLARAPHDPDSGGSQFYICLEPQPSLDGDYAVFGRVIKGMEVVDAIKVGDRLVATTVVQGAEPTNPEGASPLSLFDQR